MKNLKVILFCLAIIILSIGLGFGAEEAHNHHHGVTPGQIKNLIWFSLNFLVLVAILYKFGKKPLVEMFK
ncbi:MAG: ATP synthase F0 subunit B, partial [Thermodesulfobacteriota bacterium]